MKRGIFLSLALCVFVAFAACKKSNPWSDDPFDMDGMFTMEIDGKEWKATVSNTVTAAPVDEEDRHYAVTINAVLEHGEGNKPMDAMTFILYLTEPKFNNPKGNYDLKPSSLLGGDANVAYANYMALINSNTGISGVYHPTAGTLTVTDYKIKEQGFAGQTAGKGFSRVAGTFSGTFVLTNDDQEAAANGVKRTLTITKGKFDVKNMLNFFN